MNKLATIEKIHSIQPHPNPEVEKLEVGKVKEWPVVIPKGQFHDGDLVVFIQIERRQLENNSNCKKTNCRKYKTRLRK